MGGKSVRRSWDASQIEKLILKERKKKGVKGKKKKVEKSLGDAFG